MSTGRIIKIILFTTLPIVLFVLMRVLNVFNFYKVMTTSMEPSIKMDEVKFVSRFSSLKKDDVIFYQGSITSGADSGKPSCFAQRMVAIAGDKLEIKRGVLYLNDKLAEDTMKYCYSFITAKSELPEALYINGDNPRVMEGFYPDSMFVNFTWAEISRMSPSVHFRRIFFDEKNIRPSLFGSADTILWSTDNFGPVVIPSNCCFVLGDNRENSYDSRQKGFVKMEDVIGKVLNCK